MEISITKLVPVGTCVVAHVQVSGLRPHEQVYVDHDLIGEFEPCIIQPIFLSPSTKEKTNARYITVLSSFSEDVAIVKVRIWLEEGVVKSQEVVTSKPKEKKKAKGKT